jgi:hypothetical protein
MADRVEVPPELADAVLFASDRQCCICRDGNTRVQIHHIDGNRSHNAFDNLAVTCFNHHSEAHSREAFVRNLTPGLVRQYNDSWRALVRLRLTPTADPQGLHEFTSEVFLEFSLNCHAWKIQYMTLYPGGFRDIQGDGYVDVWDMMIAVGEHSYSEAQWQRYLPLFVDGMRRLFQDFDRTLALYPEVLSIPFKTMVLRARRRLDTTQRLYTYLPILLSQLPEGTLDPNTMFKQQFAEAILAIRDISREADRLRELSVRAS